MTHGERYLIQLDTSSEPADGESVHSGKPLSAYHTVREYAAASRRTTHSIKSLTVMLITRD